MPLILKTLQEAAAELGIPEAEIKALVDLRKVRAVLKKGHLRFAPDEIAKIKRLRKSLPESATRTSAAQTATQQAASQVKPAVPKPAVPRPVPPRRPLPPRRSGL